MIARHDPSPGLRAGILARALALFVAVSPAGAALADGGAPAAEHESGGIRTHGSGAFEVGAVGSDGFGAGFVGTYGWDLTDLFGLEFSAGLGGKQGRGGGAVGGLYTHVDALLPVTFNVCASIPRVCPALDLEISLLSGLGYAYLDGLHGGNFIIGFSVSSLRKTQDMDVGVRTAVLTYLDILGAAMESSSSRLLGLVTLELGFVIRWGVTQP